MTLKEGHTYHVFNPIWDNHYYFKILSIENDSVDLEYRRCDRKDDSWTVLSYALDTLNGWIDRPNVIFEPIYKENVLPEDLFTL